MLTPIAKRDGLTASARLRRKIRGPHRRSLSDALQRKPSGRDGGSRAVVTAGTLLKAKVGKVTRSDRSSAGRS